MTWLVSVGDVYPFNMILSHWPCVFFPSKNIQGSVGSTSRWISQSSLIILIPSSNMSVCLDWVCMGVLVWELVVSDLTACHFVSHNRWLRFGVTVSNLLLFRVTFLLTTASVWLTSDWSSNTSWAEPIAAIIQGRDFGRSITTFLDQREYVIVLFQSIFLKTYLVIYMYIYRCKLNICPPKHMGYFLMDSQNENLFQRKFVMCSVFYQHDPPGKRGKENIFHLRHSRETAYGTNTTINLVQRDFFTHGTRDAVRCKQWPMQILKPLTPGWYQIFTHFSTSELRDPKYKSDTESKSRREIKSIK